MLKTFVFRSILYNSVRENGDRGAYKTLGFVDLLKIPVHGSVQVEDFFSPLRDHFLLVLSLNMAAPFSEMEKTTKDLYSWSIGHGV